MSKALLESRIAMAVCIPVTVARHIQMGVYHILQLESMEQNSVERV